MRAVLVAVVLLPIVVAVVRALVNDWFPIGDSALLYVRARDVATAHHPLLGSWTSASLSVGEQMNNPGPLYDDLLAPIARTLPFSSAAAIAVGAVNAACVLGISGVSRAVGGWAMQRWMLVACAAMSWVLGSELLIDIWQAHALLLPFLLYLVLMIGLACGEARWIPFAAGVASVLVQTHISYVFVLTAATVAALAVCCGTQLATAGLAVAAGVALQDGGMDCRRGGRVLGAADLGAAVRTPARATSPACCRTHPGATSSWALRSASA